MGSGGGGEGDGSGSLPLFFESKLLDLTLKNKGWVGGMETIRSVLSPPPPHIPFLFLLKFRHH